MNFRKEIKDAGKIDRKGNKELESKERGIENKVIRS